MPFALAIIGIFLLVSAVRGTTDGPNGLFALVVGDFTGPSSFVYWMVAILLIGALGYIPKAKPISTAMLGLIIVVLFLAKGDPSKAGGGFFEKFTQGLATTEKPPANGVTNSTAAAAAGTLAPGQTGVQSVIQSGIQNLPSGAPAAPAMNPIIQQGINGLGGIANGVDFTKFGSDLGGWIN